MNNCAFCGDRATVADILCGGCYVSKVPDYVKSNMRRVNARGFAARLHATAGLRIWVERKLGSVRAQETNHDG